MEVKVRFRFNKRTGGMELEVDQQQVLARPEHDARHDRLADQIGSLVENNPDVQELLPGAVVEMPEPDGPVPDPVPDPVPEPAKERREEPRGGG